MVCPKCGAQLDDDSRFCKFCGAAASPSESSPKKLTPKKIALIVSYCLSAVSAVGLFATIFDVGPFTSMFYDETPSGPDLYLPKIVFFFVLYAASAVWRIILRKSNASKE
ncbi:MAG: zinc ribbon domain-containing protein [Firmicutes bacterium]|nr:zinc ribbon domain-containing protein [Bacillota bacterium]